GEEEAPDADAVTWRFFQPFQGGSVFVATQAIGWTLFSSTVVSLLLLAKQLVAGVGYCLRWWALAAGALMVATQLVLGVSILTFQHRRRARKLLQPVLLHPRDAFARAAGLVMPVVMMYLPLHVSTSAMAALFVLLPPRLALLALAAVLLPYFVITLRGHPAHTGCRRWQWLCRWFGRVVEGSLAWWSGSLTLIRDFPGTADQAAEEALRRQQREEGGEEEGGVEQEESGQQPRRRYVLGFHPHGLYPTGAGFLPLMPGLQCAFPGHTIVTLTASIVHYLPGLRDIAGWAGFRQVTRATFRRALRDTGAVLLCPGGQAELVYADRAFPTRGSPAAAAAAAFAASTSTSFTSFSISSPPCYSSGSKPTAACGSAACGPAQEAGSGHGTEATQAVSPPSSATPLPSSSAGETPDGASGGGVVRRGGSNGVPHQPPHPQPRPHPQPQPHPPHQLVVFAGHQGFVRLALEEGAWLVPVLALGETLQLRNLISAPAMQRATYKRLGFPVPFILAGRWGVTTLPLRNPLVYVVGRPLPPPRGWEAQRRRRLGAAEGGQAAEGGLVGEE
ncbi:hypothetical protein Agub_g14116, partial [Astrephomene gubernaculifera]